LGVGESEASLKSGSEKKGKEEEAGSDMIWLSFSGLGPINVSGPLHMHLYYSYSTIKLNCN